MSIKKKYVYRKKTAEQKGLICNKVLNDLAKLQLYLSASYLYSLLFVYFACRKVFMTSEFISGLLRINGHVKLSMSAFLPLNNAIVASTYVVLTLCQAKG